MIIPSTTLHRFNEDAYLREAVFESVRGLVLHFCETNGFAFLGRIKTLESTAEKIETGRFANWSALEDLVACTVIIPTLLEEDAVVSFCREHLIVDRTVRRGQASKPADSFRFDATRVWCRLRKPEGLDTGPGRSVYDIPFEVQVRTAFEHAWSVSTHKLAYKSNIVDWKRLRLAAQIKAAVEQLDTLIMAYEEAASHMPSGSWPEVERKRRIVRRVSHWIENGDLPSELAPKDYSRLADNLYSLLRCAGKEDDTKRALDRIESAISSASAEMIPRSISLFQYFFAVLVGSEFISLPLQHIFYCHITPELLILYPNLNVSVNSFDYES